MTKIIPTDVYEKNGDMKGIEFNNLDGGFIVFAEFGSFLISSRLTPR